MSLLYTNHPVIKPLTVVGSLLPDFINPPPRKPSGSGQEAETSKRPLIHRKDLGRRRINRAVRPFLFLLIILNCCSLITVGSLVWIDNSVALIPDGNTATQSRVKSLVGLNHPSLYDELITISEQTQPSSGDALLAGNGDLDDNREESFVFRTLVSLIAKLFAPLASSNFRERYTAKSYIDFGLLRLMPELSFHNCA